MKRYWCRFFLVVFPLMFLWSIANPMFASPDEPSHMVRAQGIVRGDFEAPYKVDGIPVDDIKCLAFQEEIPASCMKLEWADPPTYEDSTATNYPPLFHFLAGLPSLLFSGLSGAYIMRIWMALICSGLLALAGAILFHRYRSIFSLLGWGISITPMTLFLSGTVNPSGLAIALGSVVWAAGITLFDSDENTDKKWVRRVMILSSFAFLLVRRDALLWLLSIGSSLAVLNLNSLKFYMSRSKLIKPIVLCGTLLIIGALWALPSTSILNGGNANRNRFGSIPNDTYTYLKQAIGWFGWLDAPLSEAVMALAILTIGLFVLIGLLAANRELSKSMLTTGILIFLIPLMFAEFRYPYFQGRYYLPFMIGLSFLAARSLAHSGFENRIKSRLTLFVCATWGLVHIWSFLTNLIRYAKNSEGWWISPQEGMWYQSSYIVILFGLVVVGIVLTLLRSIRKETYL